MTTALESEVKKTTAFYGVLLMLAVSLLAFRVAAHSQIAAQDKKADAPSGNAEKGKSLYTSDGCYECHGRQGQGSKTSGPRLAPNPIAFAAFSKYIREPKGQMPPYTGAVVSDGDLANIYAFLKSIPQPPSEQDIPLLK